MKNAFLIFVIIIGLGIFVWMAYIQIKPLWIKANTEIEQKDILSIQVEYDRRQTEALEAIVDELKKNNTILLKGKN